MRSLKITQNIWFNKKLDLCFPLQQPRLCTVPWRGPQPGPPGDQEREPAEAEPPLSTPHQATKIVRDMV